MHKGSLSLSSVISLCGFNVQEGTFYPREGHPLEDSISGGGMEGDTIKEMLD